MKLNNYSMNFFGRINGEFYFSPQGYHNKWRKAKGSTKPFLGPWDYAGSHKPIIKSKYHGPQETITAGTYKEPKGFLSPGNTIGKGVSRRDRGFVSPVDGYQKTTTRSSYRFGYNQAHTEAIGDE